MQKFVTTSIFMLVLSTVSVSSTTHASERRVQTDVIHVFYDAELACESRLAQPKPPTVHLPISKLAAPSDIRDPIVADVQIEGAENLMPLILDLRIADVRFHLRANGEIINNWGATIGKYSRMNSQATRALRLRLQLDMAPELRAKMYAVPFRPNGAGSI